MPLLRRPLIALVALVLVAAGTVAPAPAHADTRSQREEVQRKRAAVAAEVDALRATDEEVEAALRTLTGDVRARTADLRDAERQRAAADAAVAAAAERVIAKQGEISALEDAVQEMAVEAYMRSPMSAGLLTSLSADTIGEAEVRRSLLDARSTHELDVLDQLERARDDLEAARAEADRTARAAEQRQEQVSAQLRAVDEARLRQETVVAGVQERLDQRLAESQALAELDEELAAQIEAEQARLAEQLREQRASQEAAAAAAARAAEEAARRAPSRNVPAPAEVTRPAPAPEPAPRATIPITGSGSIVSVRGIRVHQSVADSLARLLADADAAGITLSGGGYRDPAGQIAVRRANCGTSSYAIYQMPASSCRPPTARPGTSMHERGLAVDFTHGGRVIRSRSSSAFQWLRANAASYGFYNLPSEPWHWSVNGR